MKYSEYKIIKKVIEHTKNDSLTWIENKNIFQSKFNITEKKQIEIEFIFDYLSNKHSITFIFKHDNIIDEIVEIYLYNIISEFKYYKLKYLLTKLYKNIKKKI